MGLKAAVQALKKAEELKAKVSRHNDLLNNSEAWSDQQQLQTIYHQVLVLDLEYALDKKVEQELWTLGFKNHIAALQHLSRDKKNPRRSECQALLSWCLEAASGFYLTLLQELCSTFELELPFRRRGAVYGQTRQPSSDQLIQPQKTSCLYICQYCLVHLGDIARYRGQRKQAESFYRHAILLSPSSGQPYNQLALLEASRGDRLATVFHYVRSISVKYPFPAAATNLANTFSALIDSHEPIPEGHSKLSQNEFILIFLRVHSHLHTVTNLNQAENYIKTLNATFTALVATQMFSATKLIQITAINMYAFTRVNDSISANQLTNDEIRVKNLVLELIAGALNAFLLPIYTINENSLVLDYYALPAIKLTLDWIKTDPSILNDAVFTKKLQLWPSFCKLLNNLQEKLNSFDATKYTKTPLPEDRDLQCFLPLVKAFKELDFNTDNLSQDTSIFNNLRITRLVELGIWLCSQQVNNNNFMTYTKTPNTNNIFFEPKNKQPDPTTELLEELKFFNIQDSINITTKDNVQNSQSYKTQQKGTEKRGGILKPQGSLEKSREEREQALLASSSETDNSSCNTSLSNSSLNSQRSENSMNSKNKRVRQNVAMQAIAKKVEESNKQVTFQTEPIVKTIEKDLKHQKNNEIQFKQVPNVNQIPMNEIPNIANLSKPPPNMLEMHGYPVNYNQNQNFNRLNVNVGNIPFSGPVPFPNNPTGMFQNNLQFTKPPPVPLQNVLPNQMKPPNLTYDTNMVKQNPNLTFDTNTMKPNPTLPFNNQNVPMPPKDPFTPWVMDEKPPLPPNNWWANQKPPINFPQQMSNSFDKPNYQYNQNMPSNLMLGNFVSQDCSMNNSMPNSSQMDFNSSQQMQFNNGQNQRGGIFGNWNGPNLTNMTSNNMQYMNPGAIQPNQSNQNGGKDNRMNQGANSGINIQPPREPADSQTNQMPGYSLFNSNWAPVVGQTSVGPNSPTDLSMMRNQSLFSGPGPSPLERLLQQQRQMRGGPKDHT